MDKQTYKLTFDNPEVIDFLDSLGRYKSKVLEASIIELLEKIDNNDGYLPSSILVKSGYKYNSPKAKPKKRKKKSGILNKNLTFNTFNTSETLKAKVVKAELSNQIVDEDIQKNEINSSTETISDTELYTMNNQNNNEMVFDKKVASNILKGFGF